MRATVMYPNDPNTPSQPNQTPPEQEPTRDWSQLYAAPPQQSSLDQQPTFTAMPPQSPPAPYDPVQPVSVQPQPHNNFNIVPQPMSPKKLPPNQVPLVFRLNEWVKQHWRMLLLALVGVIVVGITIFQIVYPNTRLLPGAQVDGIAVGGMRKEEAAKKLDGLYDQVKMSIFFGKNEAAFIESTIKDMGVRVVNEKRIAQMEYPLYLKFVPGSIFWANNIIKPGALEYAYDSDKIQAYTEGKVGETCTIPAKDATLKLVDSQLQLVQSVPGGECDITEFQKAIAEATPVSSSGAKENQLRIDSTETPAAVDDDKARSLADMLNKRLKDPMPISLGANSESVPGRVVMSWLDFKSDVPKQSIDNANQVGKLVYSVNGERMATYLNSGIAAKVIKKPGVSKVSTLDFTETARVDGEGGTSLDLPKITTSVTDYIDNKTNQAVAVTHAVGPTVIYTRNYTPTSVGYRALLTQFAQDNPGTYGLALTELSGVTNPRSASYNADARFASAGIESLYIGYAVVTEQHKGNLLSGETVAGSRKVDTCFKDMYFNFDEACRVGFYERFGHNLMATKGAELGLKNTTFANRGGTTSANDLQKVLVGLYKTEIARAEGGQKILGAARSIRASEGIPAGSGEGEVAHFIGENETVRNDAAVVYSSKGIYVLSVVSDGSSWEKIAELTKKIQAFKQVKVPKDAR